MAGIIDANKGAIDLMTALVVFFIILSVLIIILSLIKDPTMTYAGLVGHIFSSILGGKKP